MNRRLMRILCLVLAVMTGPHCAAGPPSFKITVKKAQDAVAVKVEQDTVVFTVSSPSGIGGASVALERGPRPAVVVVRLRLHGLEAFAATCGRLRLSASMISGAGKPKRLYFADGDQERPLPPEATVESCDAQGRPISGGHLPEGGYFEVRLPKVLFSDASKPLELGWIDFYRR